jgi:hypothetical protein
MTDVRDEEVTTRRRVREEAARLSVVEKTLEEAVTLARKLEFEPWKDEIPQKLTTMIEEIQGLYSRSMFTRVLHAPTPIDRFRRAFANDRFLLYAVLGTVLVILDLTFNFTGNANQTLEPWKHLYLEFKGLFGQIFSPAYAGPPDGPDVIKFGVFGLISIGFIFSLVIIGWSDRADARKWAMDFLKTTFGILVGKLLA